MGFKVTRNQFIRLKQIEKELGTLAALELLKSGFAYSDWAVLVANKDHTDFNIEKMHWEFIPSWIKDMEALKAQRKKGIPWLNAKAENLFVNEKGQKSMWADAARNRRCLVPATHFFEWRHFQPEGAKKDIAYPYLIEMADNTIFYMAGIWTPWTDHSTGEMLNTFAIVTTVAVNFMAAIHNTKKRQPSILQEDFAWDWIMKNLTDEEILKIAGYQLPSEFFSAYTLSKDFKTSENPLSEFEYNELPPLDIAI